MDISKIIFFGVLAACLYFSFEIYQTDQRLSSCKDSAISSTTLTTPASPTISQTSDSRSTPAQLSPLDILLSPIKSQIVRKTGNGIQPSAFPSNVDVVALYFSAHWCPPCRAFTPELVKFYSNYKPRHNNFETLFISLDKNKESMEGYINEARMEWFALPPSANRNADTDRKEILKYCGQGIPCLVFIDKNGKVISDSYKGSRYLGPNAALKDFLLKFP